VVVSAVGAASVQVLSVVGEGVAVAGEALVAGVLGHAVEQVLEAGTAVAAVPLAAVQIFLLVVVLVLLSAVAVVLCHMAQCQ
jgi:hypothetical protein